MDFTPIFNKTLDFIKKYYLYIITLVILIILYFYFHSNSKLTEVASIKKEGFPPIRIFENVFSQKECKKIIKLATPNLKRSTMGAAKEVGTQRTSSTTWLNTNKLPCLMRVSKMVEELTGMPMNCQEDWQFLKYEPGQEYKPHYDACSPTTADYKACLQEEANRGWGKRVFTFFIYLNDVEEGGHTRFPKLDVNIYPKRGKAALWHNLIADRSLAHPLAEHAGTPPKKGEKYAINVWIRERPEWKKRMGANQNINQAIRTQKKMYPAQQHKQPPQQRPPQQRPPQQHQQRPPQQHQQRPPQQHQQRPPSTNGQYKYPVQ